MSMRGARGLPVWVAFAVTACAAAAPAPVAAPTAPSPIAGAAPAFAWPVADGWRREAFPFPLEFAPTLPHVGTEELRFAPGFFEPTAPGYWTYAFVWVISDDGPLDAATLATELTAYFRGLSAAVVADRPDAPAVDLATISVALGDAGAPAAGASLSLAGTIATIDVFVTNAPVALEVTLTVQPCGAGRALVLLASPRPRPDPIRDALDAVGASFRCD